MAVEVNDMTALFELEIRSFPNGDSCERYGIGVFRTRDEAVETAKRYLREIRGFKDYYCEYDIRETELVGGGDPDIVHTWFGWNVDEDENEIDLLSGLFYEAAGESEAAMEAAKAANDRQEWVLNRFQIGKCEWTEGFIRDYPSGRIAPTMQELRDELNAHREPRTLCGVEYEYSDNPIYGFPVAVGEQLFLLAQEDDFVLDGFTIRRLRDIYEFQSRKGMYQQISEAEGLTRFEAPAVDVSDWQSVFASLRPMGKHIIVEREYEDGYFYIGTIEAVAEDHVLLRHYDADGVWQEEPIAIRYPDVTSVSFGTRYAEVFSKYV